MKYHMIKNIMIASAGSVLYYQSIANIPKTTTWIGTITFFAMMMVLLNDADKHFARRKDRRESCQEKKMSA